MNKQKYETLKELLQEVKSTRCFDTNIDFIVHVQDLIGHSTENDLFELSREFTNTFYWVYDEAEGTDETLKFFVNNSRFSEKLQTELADAEADRDKYKFLFETEQSKNKAVYKELNDETAEHIKTTAKLTDEIEKNNRLEKELIELKAKLYDLMTK